MFIKEWSPENESPYASGWPFGSSIDGQSVGDLHHRKCEQLDISAYKHTYVRLLQNNVLSIPKSYIESRYIRFPVCSG